MTEPSTIVDINYNDKIYDRSGIPEDYHCDCDYCRKNFLGEIFHTPSGNHYTQFTRRKYYASNKETKATHIAPGHWVGYRYAIQKFTKEGDYVLDPTIGTGTAVVEAINNGRNGTGIELEYDHITRATIQKQYDDNRATGKGSVISGDARECETLLKDNGFEQQSFNLILNGTPYPVLGANQSDAPERGINKGQKKEEDMIFYKHMKNVGVLKGQKYWDTVNDIYKSTLKFLKPGGKFVTIIKDPTQKKKGYLLHKMITDMVLENNPDMKYYGSFIHKHLPYTYFMRTYPKRYPEVRLPYYQTGIVLEKSLQSN